MRDERLAWAMRKPIEIAGDRDFAHFILAIPVRPRQWSSLPGLGQPRKVRSLVVRAQWNLVPGNNAVTTSLTKPIRRSTSDSSVKGQNSEVQSHPLIKTPRLARKSQIASCSCALA